MLNCVVGLSYKTITRHSYLDQFEQELKLTEFSVGGLIKTLLNL